MADIFVGSVAVGVVPDARGWNQKLRQELVPSSRTVGDEVGQEMGRKITDQMGKAGEKSGGAFDETFRKRVKAALDAIPRDAEGPLGRLRARLEELSRQDIIDGDKAVRELLKIDTGLEEVRRKSKDITLSFDTKEARAQLALLRRDIGKEGAGTSRGGFLGGIGRLFGGGTIAAAQGAGGAASLAGQAAPGAAQAGGGLFSNPYAAIGIVAAGLTALPFLAQAAAGAITFGLGGALAGIGLLGASMDKSFQDSTTKIKGHTKTIAGDFTKFKDQIKKDLMEIGQPLVPVLHNILNTAMSVMKTLTPLFRTVMGVIAGPLKIFVDTILRAFTLPAVQQSIKDVSKAFVAILNAFTPDIPGIATSLAEAISRMADAVAKNPKAFADFINFIFQIVIAAINVLAWLTLVANWIEKHWFPVFRQWGPVIGRALAPLIDAYKRIFPLFLQILKDLWNILKILIPVIGALAVVFIKVLAWAIQDIVAPLIQRVLLPILGRLVTVVVWVRNNWRKVFHEIAVIFDGFRHEVAHIWSIIWNNTIAKTIQFGHDLEAWYTRIRHWIANIWDGVRHDTAHIWDIIWNNTIAKVIQMGHDIEAWFNRIKQWVINILNGVKSESQNIWNTVWANTVGRAIRGAQDVYNVFVRLKTNIINWFHDSINWLYNVGHDIITGLWNGVVAGAKAGGNFVNDVKNWIVSHIKSAFGIRSPSTVMIPVGQNIVAGIMHGIMSTAKNIGGFIKNIFGGWPSALGAAVTKGFIDIAKLPQKALQALGAVGGAIGRGISGLWHKVFGGGGGGVQQWAGTVIQALGMLHLPLSLLGAVLYQMQTESGGNPNAINLWDINAQHGDPSRGLMQVIGATFAAYHVPGTSGNIYDPLANIAAALNYAMHNRGFGTGAGQIGSGHGYDSGGWLPPGVTLAVNNTRYPELVVSYDQLRSAALAGGSTYHAHFDGLTGAAIESHVRSAFQAMSLTQGNLGRQGRRS